VPGEEEGQDLVTKLFVGHAAAVFVARLYQHRKQIAGVAPRFTTLSNDSINRRIQSPDRAPELDHGRGRKVTGDRGQEQSQTDGVPHQHIHCRGDFPDLLRFHVEQRPHHDAQRELHHLLMDVASLTVLVLVFPRGEHLLGVAGHDFRVGRDPLAVKCRLRKPSLPQP